MKRDIMGILLVIVGLVVIAGASRGWWDWLGLQEGWVLGVVGIGLMILGGDLLRRGWRRSRRSR